MPHLPSERDPRLVQSERDTPGRRAAARATFGDSEEVRRDVAKDALRMGHSIDAGLEPKPGHPGRPRYLDADEERALAEGERIFPARDDERDPIDGRVVAFTDDDDGAEAHGPFIAGTLSGEAMRRSGEVVVEEDSELPSLLEDEEDYDDEDTWEGFDDDTEAVYIDVDTGEAVDAAELDEYGLIDEGGGLPPAA